MAVAYNGRGIGPHKKKKKSSDFNLRILTLKSEFSEVGPYRYP